MTSKALARRAVDVVMTALLPVLMASNLTLNTFHEISGMLMFALFILHHILNWKSYRAAFVGKRDLARMLHTAVNILLFLAMIGIAISAVIVSRLVFSFMDARGGLFARKLHVCTTSWGFILMAVHLGLHWSLVTGAAAKLTRNMDKCIRSAVSCIAAALISAYGILASFTHDFGAKLIMYYGYSFWDFERNGLLFFADIIAIMGLFVCATHYALSWIRMRTRKSSGETRPSVRING
jgi:hypothetical protein